MDLVALSILSSLGPSSSALSGCPVEAADLRGGAALVLAGMAAEGVTEISGVSHIDRGYENFEAKLLSLGANIERKVEQQQQQQQEQLVTGIA